MSCATYVINRPPLSLIYMMSPYEMMFTEKRSVKHLKVFGSICYAHIPHFRRTKLDPKAKKCIFIGYDERKKGWKCLDPDKHEYTISRDVVFDEISSYCNHYEAGTKHPLKIGLPLSSSVPFEEEQGERGSTTYENGELNEEENINNFD